MRKFIYKLFGFSLGPILGAFIGFLTVPVTTYFISPTEMGKASMFTVFTTLILSVLYLGLDQSFVKEYHSTESKKKLLLNAISLPMILSLTILLMCVCFGRELSKYLFGDSQYYMLAILFGIQFLFANFERFILLQLRMEEKAVQYSMFSVLLKIIVFIVTLLLIAFGMRTFQTIVIATASGQVIGDLILLFLYKDYLSFSKDLIDLSLIKRMLAFGLPLVIASSLTSLLNTVGRIFLRNYSDFHELGIFTAALKISTLITLVQVSFSSFWTPVAFRWNKDKVDQKHYSFISNALMLVLTFFLFGVLIFKDMLIMILSSEYSEAKFSLGLLCLVPILYTVSETTAMGISFSGKSYYQLFVSIWALVPAVILSYLLIPSYGTIGSAFSIAIGYMFFLFSRTFYSFKQGYHIAFKGTFINSFIFLLAATINAFDYRWVLIVTITLFIISIFTQIGVIKTVKEIRKHPENWDFS